jgi:ATP-dependent exoDNAse (exonuclease V) beta subunit
VPYLLVDGERIGLRLQRLDGEKATPALDYDALCAERTLAEAEEEQRIVYVAMTRARERLLLSGAIDFERWPEPAAATTAISWLGRSLAQELPSLARAAPAGLHDLAVGPRGARVRCRLNDPAGMGAQMRLEEIPTRQSEPAARPRRSPHGANGRAPLAAVEDREHPAAEIAAVSYTSLSELERCGYRFYLERVLGLPEDRAAASSEHHGRAGLDARARGTLVHRLLEEMDFARPQTPGAGDVGRVARELGLQPAASERAELAQLLAAASASPPAARVAAAVSVRREHPFAFALGRERPLITGVIDRLAREQDGGFVVLDYKTDRLAADADLGALVERDYALQRLLYALAVLRSGAASVEIVHWFLERPREWVAARYREAERAELERRLCARIDAARAGSFSVSREPHRGLCERCPGRAQLCSWGARETLRERPERLLK